MIEYAALAFLLGFKHSFDADHLLAVSNLLGRVHSLKQAAFMGLSWAAGHMATATAVTLLLFFFREPLLPLVLGKLDLLVGAMLVLLGAVSLAQAFGVIHLHRHEHAAEKHERLRKQTREKHGHYHLHLANENRHLHKHMLAIGVVQGLASNDELLVLVTSTLGLRALPEIIFAVLLFSAGVVAGMMAYSLLLASAVVNARKEKFANAVNAIAGGLSIAYGIALLAGMA